MTEKVGSTKLTRKAEQAIAALLEHPTIAEAAKACGVSERSLWRWLQREDFRLRFRAAQREVVESAVRELQAANVKAVKTLVRNLDCGQPFAENAAAQAILTHTYKAIELLDLQGRVEMLEKALPPQQERKTKAWH
jgi:phage antirepressor YoqD-like protein